MFQGAPLPEDLNNFKDSKQYEEQLVRQRYDQAMKGDTKIIDALNMEGRNTLRNTVPNDENSFESLSGSRISVDDFLKNDQGIMVEPFISGSGPSQINFDENSKLGGHDLYSSSKACCEIITESFIKSFIDIKKCKIATVRSGNCIGGGDWTEDRIIKDCVEAFVQNKNLHICLKISRKN